MQTVIIKQNPDTGRFDVLATNGAPVHVILVEEDLNGQSNIDVDGTECVAWDGIAESNPELVKAALASYEGEA